MARNSTLAALDPQRLTAVWDHADEEGFSIITTSSDDGGCTWQPPCALHHSQKPVSYPRIVATRFGYRVFWLEHADTMVWAMAKLPDRGRH